MNGWPGQATINTSNNGNHLKRNVEIDNIHELCVCVCVCVNDEVRFINCISLSLCKSLDYAIHRIKLRAKRRIKLYAMPRSFFSNNIYYNHHSRATHLNRRDKKEGKIIGFVIVSESVTNFYNTNIIPPKSVDWKKIFCTMYYGTPPLCRQIKLFHSITCKYRHKWTPIHRTLTLINHVFKCSD